MTDRVTMERKCLTMCIRSAFPSARLTGKLSIYKDRIPAQISGLHHAAKCFSQIRRDRMPVVQPVFCHNEFAVGVEHNEIRVVSSGNSTLALAATGESSRCRCHPACEIEQRETSFANFSPHQRQSY